MAQEANGADEEEPHLDPTEARAPSPHRGPKGAAPEGGGAGPTDSPDVAAALHGYAQRVAAVLEDDLRGLYLYGSAARGCFHPAISDCDVLVVVRSEIRDAVVPHLLRVHEEWRGLPLDALFVTERQIERDAAPFLVEFAVRQHGEGRHYAARSPQGKLDLPLIRQDVYDCGVSLLGAPVCEVIRPVPWPVLAESLRALLPHLAPRFRNPVLMLCRVCYAFATRSLCSKREAGEWALTALPAEWHDLIGEAVRSHAQGIRDDAGATPAVHAFAEFCTEYVREHDG